jgi:hypothetical protein
VAGGQALRAERGRQVEHAVETHETVAAHARVGRAAGGVLGHEVVDHAGLEVLAQVERDVRQVERVRQRAGARHRLG